MDVTDSSSITRAKIDTELLLLRHRGTLTYLFNNAGYGYMMPLLDCNLDRMRLNFEVNVFGLLAVTQAFFPLLREAQGTVVNQSSIAGLPGTYQPFIGSYQASKSAVSKLSENMRVEFGAFGVKVRYILMSSSSVHGRQGFTDFTLTSFSIPRS